MIIPDNFELISAKEKDRQLNIGKEKINDLYNSDIDLTDIGDPQIFTSNKTNYFLLNVQKFDSIEDTNNNYLSLVNQTNSAVLETYKRGFPDAKIESNTSSENIDGISFIKYVLKVTVSKKTTMYVISYNHLFKDKDFIFSIIFTDVEKGEEVLRKFRKSKFKKI